MSTNWCRLCESHIVEGESTMHDPLAYWAHHVDIHISCAENQPEPSKRLVDSSDETKQVLGWDDVDLEARLTSRAMPRARQLKVSKDRL